MDLFGDPVIYISPDGFVSHIIALEGSCIVWSRFDQRVDDEDTFPLQTIGNVTQDGVEGRVFCLMRQIENEGFSRCKLDLDTLI